MRAGTVSVLTTAVIVQRGRQQGVWRYVCKQKKHVVRANKALLAAGLLHLYKTFLGTQDLEAVE